MSSAICDLIHLLYSVTAAIRLIQVIEKTLKKYRILHRLILIKCERKIVYLAFFKSGLLLLSGLLIPLKLTPTITYITKVNV